MRLTLKIHPDFRCLAVRSIDVDVARSSTGALELRYGLTGDIGELKIPPPTLAVRSDELWHHTCFEAFVKHPQAASYYELNFSPSTQWAAYRFTGYRREMAVAAQIEAPRIEVTASSSRFELRSSLEMRGLPDLPTNADWRIGVSAVIEELSGRQSFWALEHPPGKADFHHSDCFALKLSPALPT